LDIQEILDKSIDWNYSNSHAKATGRADRPRRVRTAVLVPSDMFPGGELATACNNRRAAVAARSSANGMTSIHEPEQSSPGNGLHGELERARTLCAALARRNDELELIIAASRLGFCVLEGIKEKRKLQIRNKRY